MDSLIITGTRKGLGKALAEHYLAQGVQVSGCSRGEASIEHANYEHFQLDVADEKAVVRMVRSVARAKGIDALINNAGIAAMNHLLASSSTSAKATFETNVFGTFYFLRETAKVMRKKGGRIINFSTVAVPLNLQGEALYASSKAAVESLTKIAAGELAPFGITVNAVGPTPIATDLIKGVPTEKIEALVQRQAIPRLGEVADVINAVDFFLRPESNFITGQVIYLGGVNG